MAKRETRLKLPLTPNERNQREMCGWERRMKRKKNTRYTGTERGGEGNGNWKNEVPQKNSPTLGPDEEKENPKGHWRMRHRRSLAEKELKG